MVFILKYLGNVKNVGQFKLNKIIKRTAYTSFRPPLLTALHFFMKNIPFKENQFSWLSQGLVYLILVTAAGSAVLNIYQGTAINPEAFWLVVAGFVSFLISKIMVISSGKLVSFGTKHMQPIAGNFYSFGYWLMIVGILLTFAGLKA